MAEMRGCKCQVIMVIIGRHFGISELWIVAYIQHDMRGIKKCGEVGGVI
jgi:hypothetical protein